MRDPGDVVRPSPSITEVEAEALTLPQVGCETFHIFGPGIYIREVRIKAGVSVIGHLHRRAHMNYVLAGAVEMRENDGPLHVVRAPHRYNSPPGRKVGKALEDLVWQNVFATEETDVEKLEKLLFAKSDSFLSHAAFIQKNKSDGREVDRQDFLAALEENGFSIYDARRFSEITDDLTPMPYGEDVVIRASSIEGKGVFLQSGAVPGQILCPARIAGKRTPAGRYTNHSKNPTAEFVERGGDAFLRAKTHIAPYCNELVPGDEVTVDYRQALSLAGRLR